MIAAYFLSIVLTAGVYFHYTLKFADMLEDELLLRHPNAMRAWKIRMGFLHLCLLLYWMAFIVWVIHNWSPFPYPLC